MFCALLYQIRLTCFLYSRLKSTRNRCKFLQMNHFCCPSDLIFLCFWTSSAAHTNSIASSILRCSIRSKFRIFIIFLFFTPLVKQLNFVHIRCVIHQSKRTFQILSSFFLLSFLFIFLFHYFIKHGFHKWEQVLIHYRPNQGMNLHHSLLIATDSYHLLFLGIYQRLWRKNRADPTKGSLHHRYGRSHIPWRDSFAVHYRVHQLVGVCMIFTSLDDTCILEQQKVLVSDK